MHLQSINIFGRSYMTFVSNASPQDVKNAIKKIVPAYGIEVTGFLSLDGKVRIPQNEMGLLEGVKWEDSEVDTSNIRDPLEIMPSARTLIILGKRLLDDSHDVYYRISDDYMASVEMMALDIASEKLTAWLKQNGYEAAEYTSYYLKGWAVLAGLGWIGKSKLFVSMEHGPRLRLRGILTDADLGEPHEVLGDDSCGLCTECTTACPVGAIGAIEVDRKKCGACVLNHRKISGGAYEYCTACTASCPVGMKHKVAPHEHTVQAISRQQITL